MEPKDAQAALCTIPMRYSYTSMIDNGEKEEVAKAFKGYVDFSREFMYALRKIECCV